MEDLPGVLSLGLATCQLLLAEAVSVLLGQAQLGSPNNRRVCKVAPVLSPGVEFNQLRGGSQPECIKYKSLMPFE